MVAATTPARKPKPVTNRTFKAATLDAKDCMHCGKTSIYHYGRYDYRCDQQVPPVVPPILTSEEIATERARVAAMKRAWTKTASGAASTKKFYDSKARQDYQRAYKRRPESKAMTALLKATKRAEIKELVRATKSRPCMDCGGSFNAVCMDFDHRPGETKIFSIGHAKNRTIEAVRLEMVKCDIVCANCHRIRTFVLRDHCIPCGVQRSVIPTTREQP